MRRRVTRRLIRIQAVLIWQYDRKRPEKGYQLTELHISAILSKSCLAKWEINFLQNCRKKAAFLIVSLGNIVNKDLYDDQILKGRF